MPRHHHRTDSPIVSSVDGLTFTDQIFENFRLPSCDNNKSVENVSRAFHDKNQEFLKVTHDKQNPLIELLPPMRPGIPPRPKILGQGSGRGHLKPITGDDWSEVSIPRELRGSSHSSAQYRHSREEWDDSSTSSTGSPQPSPVPPSGRKAYDLEAHLMKTLLSKASTPKKSKKRPDKPSEYMSSSESEGYHSTEEHAWTESSYTDSRFTGYSGDDNWSIASSGIDSDRPDRYRYNSNDPFNSNPMPSPHKRPSRTERKERERKHIKKYARELEDEHQILLRQWREEYDLQERNESELTCLSSKCENMFDFMLNITRFFEPKEGRDVFVDADYDGEDPEINSIVDGRSPQESEIPRQDYY